MDTARPEYDNVVDTLQQAGVGLSPAELHGGICGTLTAGGVAAAERWLDECLRDCASGVGELEGVRRRLRELELEAWQALSGTQMGFEPLIPDDSGAEIELRVQALAVWCHGFVVGLSFGGLELDALPDSSDLPEIVEDFVQISRAGLDPEEDDDDEADFALTELVEYVRVSAQLAFDELQQAVPVPPGETLH